MKRYLLSLLAVFGLSASASVLNDTLVKVNHPDSVLVTRCRVNQQVQNYNTFL